MKIIFQKHEVACRVNFTYTKLHSTLDIFFGHCSFIVLDVIVKNGTQVLI